MKTADLTSSASEVVRITYYCQTSKPALLRNCIYTTIIFFEISHVPEEEYSKKRYPKMSNSHNTFPLQTFLSLHKDGTLPVTLLYVKK